MSVNTVSLAQANPEMETAASGAARLVVLGLRLTSFRNYAALRLDVDTRPVVLTGPNGAGKTNLLEAISYLGAGRGLRGARLADVDRKVEPNDVDRKVEPSDVDRKVEPPAAEGEAGTAGAPWAVAATLDGINGAFAVGTGRDPASATARRIVRIDGKPAPGPAALAERVPVLWLTPAQDRLFLDRPNARRRYLDKLVAALAPEHASRLNDYERSLRERARLLKQGGADPAWLAALERTMAETGVAIAAARCQAAADLTRAAADGIGPFPAARVFAAGDAEAWLAEGPALEAEDRLAAALAAARGRDAEIGGASAGPHRSDMVVEHRVRALPAGELSTGEQKTLLVSILLAAARLQASRRGFAPILLLDEVSAHLDAAHRASLYDEVSALAAQAWMTGTDPGLFAPLRGSARFLAVAAGRVSDAD
jgi:DNA replication and repair protein RecF